MKTRTGIVIVTIVALGVAAQQTDLAAAYIAIGCGGIIYLLHAIEFKLNKLLSERGIYVYDDEIAKD